MIPNDELKTLTLTMLGEARGEGKEGMIAVGWTILNRVAHPSWRGRNIIDVCLKPYQFSCWNQDDPNRKYLLGIDEYDQAFKDARSIAAQLMANDIPDPTHGATYYYATSCAMPNWAAGKTSCFKLGNHLFFKDIA